MPVPRCHSIHCPSVGISVRRATSRHLSVFLFKSPSHVLCSKISYFSQFPRACKVLHAIPWTLERAGPAPSSSKPPKWKVLLQWGGVNKWRKGRPLPDFPLSPRSSVDFIWKRWDWVRKVRWWGSPARWIPHSGVWPGVLIFELHPYLPAVSCFLTWWRRSVPLCWLARLGRSRRRWPGPNSQWACLGPGRW